MKKDWMIKESELDEDQIKVLMATLDKSCVVSGCAGSGKSVLALIKAQRIQKEKGNSYQIIVFTKALCGYMNGRIEKIALRQTMLLLMRYRIFQKKRYKNLLIQQTNIFSFLGTLHSLFTGG